MTTNTEFDRIFGTTRMMAIMRGMGVQRSLAVAAAAWDLGIDVVEVPIQNAVDVKALRAVADAARDRGKTVGAGTVVTLDHVTQAARAGAQFTVSPGFDPDIIRASAAAGLPPLPGVGTGTEVQLALKEGLTWMKAFPASILGPAWIKAMHGPFPQATFAATGGMNATNAANYLAAGARVIAIGSALEDPNQLDQLSATLHGATPDPHTPTP